MSDPKPAGTPATLTSMLPAPVRDVFARARQIFFAFSRPARVMFIATTVLAIAGASLVAFDKANEPYTTLFSQLDRDDAAAIVAKLKELKVQYKVDGDGAAIEVPESKVHELRLELAGAGLPHGGGVGFESFDKMRLGATDFEQRVLYRRALEGELTRTIATIGAVESSRVHLVLPEKSVFVTRSEPASASIVLRLRSGRALGSTEVAAIVHLVAAAVPALEPDHISVVTTDGMVLHKPRKGNAGEDDLGGDDDVRSAARSYEGAVEDRVRAMLEKVVGAGHADVRVTAEIDTARVEHLEEHFDPTRSALRSEEQSTERSGEPGAESVAGVPGAESNLPGGAARGSTAKPAASASATASASAAPSAAPAPPAPIAAGSIRESHTRNFELDHVSEKRVSAGGALKRLTVAVVLDGVRSGKGTAPLSTEQMDKLALLVKSAAGASDARGDVVTVESIPFVDSLDTGADTAPVAAAPLTRIQMAKRYGPYAAGILLLLVVVGVVARRGRGKHPMPATATPLELAAGPAASTPALEAGAALPALDSGDLRTRAHSRAAQDPATAALVLRAWLGTSAPEPKA